MCRLFLASVCEILRRSAPQNDKCGCGIRHTAIEGDRTPVVTAVLVAGVWGSNGDPDRPQELSADSTVRN